MTTVFIIIVLLILLIVFRLKGGISNSYRNFPDYTTDLGSDNPYFQFKEINKELCDEDGMVSAHKLSLCGYMVLKIKSKIVFDPSEPAINPDQIVIIDTQFNTIQVGLNKGDLVLVKNMDTPDKKNPNPDYNEYLGKISTIHKDGSVSIVRDGMKKIKMMRAFIIGKIIKIS